MRRSLIVAAIGLVGLVSAAPASADPGAITVTVGGQFLPGDDQPYQLRPGPLRIDTVVVPLMVPQGSDLVHINRDLEGHNITSILVDEMGQPLFAGNTIERQQVEIITTSHLPVGDYPFVCTIHSEFMHGTLRVM